MIFDELHLCEQILRAVHEKGYEVLTDIQAECMPLIKQGKDVIGQSQTGSGKTAAFGIPMLERVVRGKGIQGLILTPTRELCVQVKDALCSFGKYLPIRIVNVYGGVGIGQQLQAVKSADILVATPGRLLDILNRGLSLTNVKMLVLDEADRMLDMGFIDDVERIMRLTSPARQTLLFSATISHKIHELVKKYMRNPVSIKVKLQIDKSLLSEKYYDVARQDKFSFLVHLLKQPADGIVLIFCGTRRMVDVVAKNLRTQHIDATPIHGGLSQSHRMHAINMLHKKGVGVLVATDVASRGLHIDNVLQVYNFDLPQTSDDYVHRIGRTARAGAKGEAILLLGKNEHGRFNSLLRETGHQIVRVQTPQFERVQVIASFDRNRNDRHRGRKRSFRRRR